MGLCTVSRFPPIYMYGFICVFAFVFVYFILQFYLGFGLGEQPAGIPGYENALFILTVSPAAPILLT